MDRRRHRGGTLLNVVNVEHVQRAGKHEHVVTFREPVTEDEFKEFVKQEAYFGYHPLQHGGTAWPVSSEGEVLRQYDETRPRQTWVWQHNGDNDGA